MKSIISEDALMAVVEGLSKISGKVRCPFCLICLPFTSSRVMTNAANLFVPRDNSDPNAIKFDKGID